MCVLTYVPIGQKGFIVTSNRDENIARSKAKPPKKISVNGHELFCPIDPNSMGTWIATSQTYTIVLLNGGDKKHEHKPPYRQSRGQVILNFMQYLTVESFYDNYEFQAMEPFTLVIFKNNDRNDISEIKWSSDHKTFKKINGDSAKIWSSSTLYDQIATENRKIWFENHLNEINQEISGEKIMYFHQNGGKNDPENSIKLKRSNGIETVCITQIEIEQNGKSMFYNDLLTNKSNRFIIY
jgi:uncharacterized protein with NRDE domain